MTCQETVYPPLMKTNKYKRKIKWGTKRNFVGDFSIVSILLMDTESDGIDRSRPLINISLFI